MSLSLLLLGVYIARVKDLAGSRMVVFSHVSDWEGDDDAVYGREAARKRSCVS